MNSWDRVLGVAVIIALMFGLWWLVFHDPNSYVLTEGQIKKVLRPNAVERASGYTVFSRGDNTVMILRSGASDDEISGAISRIEQRMEVETEKIAQEFPLESIRGAQFEFHNLIIFCAFAQNCNSYERRFLTEVQTLGLRDTSNQNFVPDSRTR